MSSRARYQCLEIVCERIANDPRLAVAHDDLRTSAPVFLDAVRRIMDARRCSLGAASYDGPRVTGTGAGVKLTVTERLAGQPDRASETLRRLDRALARLERCTRTTDEAHRLVTTIEADARILWRITQAWSPKAPTDRQRRELTDQNTMATECKLTREALRCWAAPYRTSDLRGLLPDPVPVSRWVYDFARQMGRLPTPNEWKRHGSDDDDLRRQLLSGAAR